MGPGAVCSRHIADRTAWAPPNLKLAGEIRITLGVEPGIRGA